jgi:glycosyltransferase involved in cell wall biosynthesis
MHCGVPVIAFAAGAVPETLRGAGMMIDRKDPWEIAGLMNRLLSDRDLRDAVLRSQSRRLEEFAAYPYEKQLRQALMPLM